MDIERVFIADSEKRRANQIEVVFTEKDRIFTIIKAEKLTTNQLLKALKENDLVILNEKGTRRLCELFDEIESKSKTFTGSECQVVICSCRAQTSYALATVKDYGIQISSAPCISPLPSFVKKSLNSYFQ